MCKRGGSKTYLVGAGLVGDLPDTKADERHVLLLVSLLVYLRLDASWETLRSRKPASRWGRW